MVFWTPDREQILQILLDGYLLLTFVCLFTPWEIPTHMTPHKPLLTKCYSRPETYSWTKKRSKWRACNEGLLACWFKFGAGAERHYILRSLKTLLWRSHINKHMVYYCFIKSMHTWPGNVSKVQMFMYVKLVFTCCATFYAATKTLGKFSITKGN